MKPARAFVALGSNLGPRRETLERALAELARDPRVRVVRRSPWYETEPVGGPTGQGPYLNGVAELAVELEPRALLERCLAIEAALGRVRAPGERNAARTLDLDLLWFDGRTLAEPGLALPHPRLEQRAFVVEPLADLAPELALPSGLTALERRARFARLERGRPLAESGGLRRARALAPAKINAWLEIRGRRADGYHEIDTLMLALDWCDEVRVAEDRAAEPGSIRLALAGPAASADVPRGAANLVWRAARAVLDLGCAQPALAIELEKHLPSGAGLGGGSADAAATALAVALLLERAPAPRELAAALAGLGSDCAFFAEAGASGAARCRGRGEQVAALPAPLGAWHCALFVPEVHCDTARVYAALGLAPGAAVAAPRGEPPAALLESDLEAARRALWNRLEPAALSAYPELARARAFLDAHGAAHFSLSGSGSAYFGLYASAAEAEAAARELAARAERAGLPARAVRAACLGPGARVLV